MSTYTVNNWRKCWACNGQGNIRYEHTGGGSFVTCSLCDGAGGFFDGGLTYGISSGYQKPKTDTDRIAELEARVAALEAKVLAPKITIVIGGGATDEETTNDRDDD